MPVTESLTNPKGKQAFARLESHTEPHIMYSQYSILDQRPQIPRPQTPVRPEECGF